MSTGARPAVVFDLGKVLVDFDYGLAAGTLGASCERKAKTFRDVIDHSPLLFAYESGQLTSQQFHDEVCKCGGYTGPFADFCEVFADIFTAVPEMIQLNARLRAEGAPTYIFSNTNEIAIGHIRRRFPFFSNFDGYVLSFEEGCMKPNPKIYERVEARAGKTGSDLIYIDDRIENVEAGKARGWQVIHHRAPPETIAMLDALLSRQASRAARPDR